MKKVIIVDDENAGRKLIKEFLKDYPELIIIAEANNGVDAISEINKYKPDLVFLDIQMPGFNGFEVITRLNEIPQIIFSTAYDEFASKAFEVHAVDYLLKPYTKERFKTAVTRLSSQADRNSAAPLANRLLMEKSDFPQSIFVQNGKKYINIKVEDIIWIEAYGDYSKIHMVDKAVYLSNFGISELEKKVHKNCFLRVHRSYIVNIHQIEQADKYSKSYQLTMKNREVIKVSRGYKDELQKLIF